MVGNKLHQLCLRQRKLNENMEACARYPDAIRAAKNSGMYSAVGIDQALITSCDLQPRSLRLRHVVQSIPEKQKTSTPSQTGARLYFCHPQLSSRHSQRNYRRFRSLPRERVQWPPLSFRRWMENFRSTELGPHYFETPTKSLMY